VNLHAVNGQARTRVQLLVADVTLKVFGLLMLNQDLFVVKLSIAVPAPGLHLLLLFSTHFCVTKKSLDLTTKGQKPLISDAGKHLELRDLAKVLRRSSFKVK
jgi:hypothetical protein